MSSAFIQSAQAHGIWVPTFAGMSGLMRVGNYAAAAIAAAARRRTISAVLSSRL